MSKLTDPPKCKNNCGRGAHWGPCFVRGEKPSAPSIIDVTPNKSTAARTDVPEVTPRGKARRPSVGIATQRPARLTNDESRAPRSGDKASAGTQAPPVDKLETARAALDEVTTRGTPRKRAPKGTFDRKAYQAMKARERRAKAAKSPKPS